MRDVCHETRADTGGDLGNALPIDDARVGRSAGNDQPGSVLVCERRHAVVVDDLGFGIHAVVDELVELAREADRAAVGQVAALAQLHAHDRVAGFQQGKVHSHVGGAA